GLNVLFLGIEQRVAQRDKRPVEFSVVAGPEPEVEHQRLELIAILQIAQDRADFADHQLKHANLLVQYAQDAGLQRAGRAEVEDKHFARLPRSDAPDQSAVRSSSDSREDRS